MHWKQLIRHEFLLNITASLEIAKTIHWAIIFFPIRKLKSVVYNDLLCPLIQFILASPQDQ